MAGRVSHAGGPAVAEGHRVLPTWACIIVTGAFSYTGRYITERLLADGERVRTLSRREPPAGHPLAGQVDVAQLRMDDHEQLTDGLRGASTLSNTYWIRFRRGDTTFEEAIENSDRLFRAAIAAGIERILLISVSNPSDEQWPSRSFVGSNPTPAVCLLAEPLPGCSSTVC